MDHNPTRTQCPRCHQQVITVVNYSPGVGTLLIGLTICLFGGGLGCCLIPLCVPGCQDVMHSCPACGSVIGRHNLV
jgi:lipopolysaccharide-induced tumor necrosis factor-alpha factor